MLLSCERAVFIFFWGRIFHKENCGICSTYKRTLNPSAYLQSKNHWIFCRYTGKLWKSRHPDIWRINHRHLWWWSRYVSFKWSISKLECCTSIQFGDKLRIIIGKYKCPRISNGPCPLRYYIPLTLHLLTYFSAMKILPAITSILIIPHVHIF